MILQNKNQSKKTHKSGKGEFFSPPPHTTPHAGPHGAVPGKF